MNNRFRTCAVCWQVKQGTLKNEQGQEICPDCYEPKPNPFTKEDVKEAFNQDVDLVLSITRER